MNPPLKPYQKVVVDAIQRGGAVYYHQASSVVGRQRLALEGLRFELLRQPDAKVFWAYAVSPPSWVRVELDRFRLEFPRATITLKKCV